MFEILQNLLHHEFFIKITKKDKNLFNSANASPNITHQ